MLRSGYLETARDRDTMRVGVRLGVDLTRGAGGRVASGGPQPADLASDGAVDAWIRANLGTALHWSGSAPAGIVGDARAVGDPPGQVLGVDGLRVIDLSVLPQVPSRGPAATAIMLGELLTEHVL